MKEENKNYEKVEMSDEAREKVMDALQGKELLPEPKRRRRFLGKTKDFESKEERNFEKAHLKAYLKGKKFFNHGFEIIGTGLFRQMMPISHPVKEEFYYEQPTK